MTSKHGFRAAAGVFTTIMIIVTLVKVSSVLQGEVVSETKRSVRGMDYRIREIPAGALFGLPLPFSDFLYQCEILDAKSGHLVTCCQFRFSGSQRSYPSSMRIVVHELNSRRQDSVPPANVSIYNQSVDFEFGDGWKVRCDFSRHESVRWQKYWGEWRAQSEFRD